MTLGDLANPRPKGGNYSGNLIPGESFDQDGRSLLSPGCRHFSLWLVQSWFFFIPRARLIVKEDVPQHSLEERVTCPARLPPVLVPSWEQLVLVELRACGYSLLITEPALRPSHSQQDPIATSVCRHLPSQTADAYPGTPGLSKQQLLS
ncbi:hypothetical protein RRG08_025956 [Elysia crispata]|uniref:Uncharacterized protein n=1 Tax=Elysia crispata TaxID=231223 RepID=A0AAE0ZG59_9GAST|nr:hypothetical protein RRG08_025956 [Elysia crispata]